MKLRDSFHIFIGFTIMYLIGTLTEFSEYTLDAKIIGVPIVSAFIGGVIGFFWEWYNGVKNQSFFDFKDVFRTSIGGLIGGLVSLFILSEILLYVSCLLSIILIIIDLKNIFKK